MRERALAHLDDVCRALPGSFLRTSDLHDAYRTLSPLGHPGCADDEVDVGFLARAFVLGGPALFAAARVVVRPIDGPLFPLVRPLDDGAELLLEAGPHAAGDAAMLLCGLSIESEKLRRRLGDGPPPGPGLAASLLGTEVDTLFDGRERTEAFLTALATLPADRFLAFARPTLPPLPPAPLAERDMVLIVGGGAHELFSPYARRLGRRLSQLGGDPYEGLSVLFTEAPECADERRAVEAAEGLVPTDGGILIQTARLRQDLVDPRVKPALAGLTRARWDLLLGSSDPDRLEVLLARSGPRIVGVLLIAPGIGFSEPVAVPRLLGSSQPGAPWVRLENPLSAPDLPMSQSVPSLAVGSDGGCVNTGLYDLLATVTAAMARAELPADVPVSALVHQAHDRSAQHQAVLAALAQG